MNNEITIFTEKEGRNAFTLPNLMFNPQSMEVLNQYATMLSSGGLVPEHFQGKPGDLMAVIIQAERWGIDHIAVAQSSFVLSGKLGYEAKLLQSVAKSLGGIEFSGKYYGNWDNIVGNTKDTKVKRYNRKSNPPKEYFVDATIPNWTKEDEAETGVILTATYPCGKTKQIDVKLNSCHPRNSTNWTYDPEQQIHYTAIKRFLRRHEPHLQAGIRDYDDIMARENKEVEVNNAPKKTADNNAQVVEDVDDILNGGLIEDKKPEAKPEEIVIDDIDSVIAEGEVIAPEEFKLSKFNEIKDLIMIVETVDECRGYWDDVVELKNTNKITTDEANELKQILTDANKVITEG